MNTEMLIALVNNVALLLAIGVLYDVLFFNIDMNTRLKSAAVGVIIGLIGIALMLNPWELSPGLFFDTRSILLSIVGLFFGFIPAVIGALIIGSYRLYEGGVGAVTGISVTVCSVILGLLWRQFHERLQNLFGWFDLYILGLLVHIVMLVCMLLLPWPYAFEVLKHISVPVMLIYPIGTVLLGSLLKNQLSRKITQDALKENEALLSEVGRIAKIGGWEFDVSSGKVTWTSEVSRIHEIDYEGPVGVEFLRNFYPSGSKEIIENAIQDAVKNGISYDLELEFRTAKGNHKWVRVNGIPTIKDGKVIKIIGSLQDITERKQAEIIIAEEAIRRRVLIEQSSDGIVILDQNGKVFEANQKYADMLGYSPEEVLTLHMWDWDTQLTREELLRMVRDVDGSGDHFETRHQRKDGTLLDVEVSSNAAMFGELKLIFCVCRDITERKQAEGELLNAKQEAESANVAKSQFLANMGHELRTPLNGIIGFSDVLSSKMAGELTEKQLRYANNISESGKHLLELINDILDLSKMEAGKMELKCEKFSVTEAFDNILAQMAPMASRKNISIKIENKFQTDEMFADRQKFIQIMCNLLGNAIKFTSDNGKVLVVAEKNYSEVRISVSDSGIGISEHRLKDIFNPFVQVDTSNKRKYGGSGLGLTLVKQFVEMHKGNIWVKSEEGKGSTFTFTITDQGHCEQMKQDGGKAE